MKNAIMSIFQTFENRKKSLKDNPELCVTQLHIQH